MSNIELLLAVQISKKKAGSFKERIAFLISVFGGWGEECSGESDRTMK